MFRIFALSILVLAVVAHVRVRQPPNRSSVWRDPAFTQYHPPVNYDDDGLYCGEVFQDETVSTCGICGDHPAQPTPRPNESGGRYGAGIIVGRYSAGEVIPLNVEFTTSHLGYFEMHLCDHVPESEDCFQLLTFGDGSTKQFLTINYVSTWVNTTLQLPTNVQCSNCVLRLQYRAGNNWGNCTNGTEGMGCGLQETFRNCVDIAIE